MAGGRNSADSAGAIDMNWKIAVLLGFIPLSVSAQPITSQASRFTTGWTVSIAANTSVFSASATTGGNQNTANLATTTTTFNNLYVRLAVAPATAESVSVTLWTGAPASMSATALTCTVAAAATTCNDTTHSVVVTAGQAWALQVITGATNAAGQSMLSISETN